ncbi:MAG TPA: hypothetical protein VGE90_00400, partial [Chitinophaga sp.]
LLRIKEAGASQMQSALVIIRRLGLSIKDADNFIVHSDAWKENKDNIIKVRNLFGDVLEGSDEN